MPREIDVRTVLEISNYLENAEKEIPQEAYDFLKEYYPDIDVGEIVDIIRQKRGAEYLAQIEIIKRAKKSEDNNFLVKSPSKPNKLEKDVLIADVSKQLKPLDTKKRKRNNFWSWMGVLTFCAFCAGGTYLGIQHEDKLKKERKEKARIEEIRLGQQRRENAERERRRQEIIALTKEPEIDAVQNFLPQSDVIDTGSSLLVKVNRYSRVFESLGKTANLLKANKLENIIYSERDIDNLFIKGGAELREEKNSSLRGCFIFEDIKAGRYALEIVFYKTGYLTNDTWTYNQLINILPNSNEIIEVELKPQGGSYSDLHSSYEKAKFSLKSKEYETIQELEVKLGLGENYMKETFINGKKTLIDLTFPDNISPVLSLIEEKGKKGFEMGLKDLIDKEAFITKFQYGDKVIEKTYIYGNLENNFHNFLREKQMPHATGRDTFKIDDIAFVNHFHIGLCISDNTEFNKKLKKANKISLFYPKILQKNSSGVKIKIEEDGIISVNY